MSIYYKWLKLKIKLGQGKKSELAYCNEKKIQELRNLGMKIGDGTFFWDLNPKVDTQRPWMVQIGSYCKITSGVIILQHDYSRSVMRRVYGDIVEGSRKTIIGDNVFIGMNSVILMGSHIGNNVIIGAGSVVSGNIPDNVVVAGNPARIIRTLEEHYQIRKSKYIDEAKGQAKEFFKTFHRKPTVGEMGAFFPIYLERNKEILKEYSINTNLSGDEEESIISEWMKTIPEYNGFEEFLKDCEFSKKV